jgi:hypothetical protein
MVLNSLYLSYSARVVALYITTCASRSWMCSCVMLPAPRAENTHANGGARILLMPAWSVQALAVPPPAGQGDGVLEPVGDDRGDLGALALDERVRAKGCGVPDGVDLGEYLVAVQSGAATGHEGTRASAVVLSLDALT